MKWDIKKYRQQQYCCCQLIAAINARIYLGSGDISEEEFDKLANLVCCKNGSAIMVNAAYPQLGLDYETGPVDPLSIEWIKDHLPVQITYYDPKHGFHAALIVGVDGDEVVLVNAAWDKIKLSDIELCKWTYNRMCRSFKMV